MKKEKPGVSTPEDLFSDKDILQEKNFPDLLLRHCYLDAVRGLAAGVIHNCNNIFGGLIGQFALLQREDLNAEEREAALGLIDELLQRGTGISARLSPFVKKKMDPVAKVAPAIMVQEVAGLLGLLSSSHRIVTAVDSQLPHLRCAPRRLLLALFHLGRNAIEAMPEGGTVDIEVERGDDRFDPLPSVVFSVSDHGRGIAEEEGNRLFEPFPLSLQFQGPQGKGLGFYAVRHFVLSQQGAIEYEAAVDRGSTFRLILPAVSPRSKEAEDAARDPAQPESAEEDTIPETGGPQVILVVEDDAAMRLLATRFLQKNNHIVFSVQDGREAIEEYSGLHDTITMVIMDAGLPDMTGQQCVRRLLAVDPELTVLYVSGDLLEDGKLYPADASLLLKPFNENELHRAIGNARKRKNTDLSRAYPRRR